MMVSRRGQRSSKWPSTTTFSGAMMFAGLAVMLSQSTGLLGSVVQLVDQPQPTPQRSFRVDFAHDRFLKDGEPFRFIAGSFHYFRALPSTWRAKLRTMRAAGLNAVTTYVEWSLHNPKDGQYVWDGIADVKRFIEIAAEEELLVILRPGPYICAERDMGGFPYWMLNKYPKIRMRTMDPDYLYEASIWYNELMPKLESLLYENGGPIIMVQVENEYGSFGCDKTFRNWMKNLTERHVRGAAVLFTNDGPSQTGCGHIDGVLATLDFGIGSLEDTNRNWQQLRKYQHNGPLVNTEFYPGWLTHWQEPLAIVKTDPIVTTLRNMLDRNASVNFYMFFGGTNFGFTAGANTFYTADLTSYDYNAPMDEAGDPTSKYFRLRDVIGEYLPLPNLPLPVALPKMSLGSVVLNPIARLLSRRARALMGTNVATATDQPQTFEQLNQYSGFVLYETKLPRLMKDPSLLVVNDLHDRAHVFVDRHFIGILSRENLVDRLPIQAGLGTTLQILVENQGRINFVVMEDFKGILGDVLVNGKRLSNWTSTGYPMEDHRQIEDLINDMPDDWAQASSASLSDMHERLVLPNGPVLLHGVFNIDADRKIHDTYLDTRGWGKGIAFVNGFNLGRYWPLAGPQITLYVPKDILQSGENYITLLELERIPAGNAVDFVSVPNLNGY